MERPRVVFNEKTNQYVMYLHIDNALYTESKVGVASAHRGRPYTYWGSAKAERRVEARILRCSRTTMAEPISSAATVATLLTAITSIV